MPRVGGQRPRHEGAELGRDVGPVVEERRGLAVPDPQADVVERRVHERALSGQGLVEDDAYDEEITRGLHPLLAERALG